MRSLRTLRIKARLRALKKTKWMEHFMVLKRIIWKLIANQGIQSKLMYISTVNYSYQKVPFILSKK